MAVAAATRRRRPSLWTSAVPRRPRSIMSPTNCATRPPRSAGPPRGCRCRWRSAQTQQRHQRGMILDADQGDNGRWQKNSARPRPILNQPRPRARPMRGAYCMSGGAVRRRSADGRPRGQDARHGMSPSGRAARRARMPRSGGRPRRTVHDAVPTEGGQTGCRRTYESAGQRNNGNCQRSSKNPAVTMPAGCCEVAGWSRRGSPSRAASAPAGRC